MEIKDYIKVYDNLLNYKTLSNFLRYANTLNFEEATVGANNTVRLDIRNTFNYSLSNLSDKLSDVHWCGYLTYIFDLTFKKYQEHFNHAHFNQIETVEILKYNEGGFYKEHVDHFRSRPRTLSGILLLNNDYEGGNICFKLGNEDLIIDKAPNRFIVWPSNFIYPHEVKKVTKGVRYSVVTWAL